jgi:hypothetical protein
VAEAKAKFAAARGAPEDDPMATKKTSSNGGTKRIETEKRRCAVKLTAAECGQRADEMAECELKIEQLKADKSELARQVKTHERRRNELGHAIENKTEERELLCEWRPDYKQNAFLLTRPDTNEPVDSRPMTADDRNVDLWPMDAPTATKPLPATPPRSPARRGRPPGKHRLTSVPTPPDAVA